MDTLNSTEKRQLIAAGHSPKTMSTEKQREALAAITRDALTKVDNVVIPAPTPKPTTAPGGADTLINTFMTGGADAFKHAITTHTSALETDLSDARRTLEIVRDDLATEQAKEKSARVVIKTADADGNVIVNTALTERPASELFDLSASAPGLVAYATDDAVAAPEYDFNAVHSSGVLAHVLIAQATQQNVWLSGEKGTGKTTFCQSFAKATGRPFHRISHTKQMECADLIGSRIFDATGAMVWADGQLTQAMRAPNAVILLDEPSLNGGACEMYQTILDEGYLTIPATGERVALSPDHLVIAADNTSGDGDVSGGYHGTAPLNEAFLDRFAYIVQMQFMPVDIEAALLARFCSAANARAIAEYAVVIRNAVTDGQVMEPISYRRLEALAISIGCGMGSETALTTAVFNHVRNSTDEEFYRLQAHTILSLDV